MHVVIGVEVLARATGEESLHQHFFFTWRLAHLVAVACSLASRCVSTKS
jgi:hypothetical protein